MLDQNNKLVFGEPFSKEKFKHPSKEFGIMPFWFVNGEMDYKEMEWQLKQFAESGIPAIIFHSRFGIKDYMPYLGEEWLNRCKFAAEKGRELGLQTWVYDEYNWPSGTCNQEIMAEHPEMTSRYLQLVVNEIPGQFFVFMEGTDSRYNDLEQSSPIYACAILNENIEKGKNETVNLQPNLCFDKVISWEAPQGPWQLCYFIERQASWYSDVLNEDTTKEFLRKTHEKYKDSVEGPLPDSLKGFYTDEPAMHYFEAGADNMIIPWSAQMFKIFRDINGYDLKQRLPQLFFNIGDDYHKVRHDFWSCLSKQYEKAYYQQIHKWCQENDVVFTGHLLHEEWLRRHAKSGGNLFHMLKNLDMTGVDHLYPRVGNRAMPDEHVALKIASSAAHQNGSVRLLCESMGGAYWDCTMERMKWIADWEYVLGVNIFNPHGFHYSIEGERKRDWPPSQFYHHTWWKDYNRFNTYLKRLGYLMTGGHHVAKIGILYPINNLWANFVPQKADRCSALCESDFVYMTDRLLRLHYDFDYIDEDMLRKMEIADGKIRIKGEEYSLLILPPMTHIKEHTLGLLKKFYEQGGKLIGDALLPQALLEPDGTVGTGVVRDIFGVCPEQVNADYLADKTSGCGLVKNEHENGGKAVFIAGPGLEKTDGMDILRQAVSSLIDWDVSIDNEEMFYLHRIKDGVPFYFVMNPTEQSFDAEISIRAAGSPVYYDLLSGEISPIHNFTRDGDVVTFHHATAPYGSAMFSMEPGDRPHVWDASFTVTAVENGTVRGYTAESSAKAVLDDGSARRELRRDGLKVLPAIPLGDQWDFSVDTDNALLIQKWKFALADQIPESFHGADYAPAGDAWLDYTMGGWELQLPYERDEKTYPVKIAYKAEFTADYLPDDIKLLIDGFKCEEYTLYLNGKEITEKGERSFLDSEIKQILIRDYLVPGRNDIAVSMTVSKPSHGLLDYIKITGSFAVKDDRIVPPVSRVHTGTWTDQGFPYFSGTGSLTQTLSVPEEYCADHVLKLRVSCGKDVARVLVNGQDAGTLLWEPYEADVTSLIKPGENTVTIQVTNTLINLLEAVVQDSGVFGAQIVPYNQVTLKSEAEA